MADVTVNARFKNRHDTSENWNTINPVLLEGEIGVETDTGFFKIGDGVNHWKVLKYYNSVTDYVIDTNTKEQFKFWIGTQDEYLAMEPIANMIYMVV